MDSKPDEAGLLDGDPALKCELPEVFIQSQQNPGFGFGKLQEFRVEPSPADHRELLQPVQWL